MQGFLYVLPFPKTALDGPLEQLSVFFVERTLCRLPSGYVHSIRC